MILSPDKYLKNYRRFATLNRMNHLHAKHVMDENAVHSAKLLHAKIYLHNRYISTSDLDERGVMHKMADPYQEHSDYFTVHDSRDKESKVMATARLIKAHPAHGHNSFPTIKNLSLYPDSEKFIRSIDPSKCIEVSALAKDFGVSSHAVMILYRALWHHSLRKDHSLWLMACDVRAYRGLKFIFGDALTRTGDNAFYMGSEVVPAMLEIRSTLNPIMRDAKSLNPFKRFMKRELVKFLMSGMPKVPEGSSATK